MSQKWSKQVPPNFDNFIYVKLQPMEYMYT